MIFVNPETKSFIINCNCGCGSAIEFRTDIEDEYDFISLSILTSKWYSDQDKVRYKIKSRLQKIWWAIRGKEYYHCEICMNKVQWKDFVATMNQIKVTDGRLDNQ